MRCDDSVVSVHAKVMESIKAPMPLIRALSTASFNIAHFVLNLISNADEQAILCHGDLVQHDFKANINNFILTFFLFTNWIIKFSPLMQRKNLFFVESNLC